MNLIGSKISLFQITPPKISIEVARLNQLSDILANVGNVHTLPAHTQGKRNSGMENPRFRRNAGGNEEKFKTSVLVAK